VNLSKVFSSRNDYTINKMATLIELYRSNSKIIKYGLIGAASSSLDFVIYTALVVAGLNMFWANVIGVNCGIVTSFILNRRYNFKVKDHAAHRFMSFYMVGMAGLALSTGLLYILVESMALNEFFSKLVTIVAVALLQFVFNSRVTFKQTKIQKNG